jgi:hypothetical protein
MLEGLLMRCSLVAQLDLSVMRLHTYPEHSARTYSAMMLAGIATDTVQSLGEVGEKRAEGLKWLSAAPLLSFLFCN